MISNEYLSEQYRMVGLEWVRLDAAATLLEECKSAVLAQEKAKLGDIADSRAEREVKATSVWWDYIEKMCAAREAANKQKIEMEFIRMKFWEQNSVEATKRKEMSL